MNTKGIFPTEKFSEIQTPFYFYNTDLLRETLSVVNNESSKYKGYHVHYAIKANANHQLLTIIRENGLGVDCVSGGEIQAALNAGFAPEKIVFAGVGKSDWEINLGLDNDIFCFNAESIPELEVIDELAAAKGKVASIALRINPDVAANTHHYITTGLKENKFGISLTHLDHVIDVVTSKKNLKLIGLHFHIGSQILDMGDFEALSARVNELQDKLEKRGVELQLINVGGGLGIDYNHPDQNPIPNFADYFATFNKHLALRSNQELHFELGRSIVCQSGSLVTKVLYIKEGVNKKFAIVDAGMTDLIRPALYQAYHKIENISSEGEFEAYDIVGPICESSDTFSKDYRINSSKRGDLIVLRSAGAYGEIMASQYNCRTLPKAYYSEDFK